jgi:hypothetical protein
MRNKILAVLILCALSGAMALGQTSGSTPQASSSGGSDDNEVSGRGTPGYVPIFLTAGRIGNSNILQGVDGDIGIGITEPLFPLHIFSTRTAPPPGHSQPVTLWVETTAPNTQGAIQALASSLTGNTIALNADVFSPDGVGVVGNHPTTDGGGSGVVGLTSSTTGFTTGVTGSSGGSTGPGVGVFGSANSLQGVGGLFQNVPGGDIIRGGINQPVVTLFRVDGTGRVYADGGFQPSGADFAESMAVTGDRNRYAAGDLLVIDPTANRRVALAQQPYSTLVAGIYSTKPGMLGSTHKIDERAAAGEVPLAVVGIVPCKVSAENGPIRAGDLLVTSSTRGHAMRGTDRSLMLGAVVGKALEPLPQGTGVIQVLVTLQ